MVEAADNNVTWIDGTAPNQVDPRSHRVVEADPVQFASDSAMESFDLIVVCAPVGPRAGHSTTVGRAARPRGTATVDAAVAGGRWTDVLCHDSPPSQTG